MCRIREKLDDHTGKLIMMFQRFPRVTSPASFPVSHVEVQLPGGVGDTKPEKSVAGEECCSAHWHCGRIWGNSASVIDGRITPQMHPRSFDEGNSDHSALR